MTRIIYKRMLGKFLNEAENACKVNVTWWAVYIVI